MDEDFVRQQIRDWIENFDWAEWTKSSRVPDSQDRDPSQNLAPGKILSEELPREVLDLLFTLGFAIMEAQLHLTKFSPDMRCSMWGLYMLQVVGEMMRECALESTKNQGHSTVHTARAEKRVAEQRPPVDPDLLQALQTIAKEMHLVGGRSVGTTDALEAQMLREFGRLPWIVVRFGEADTEIHAQEKRHVAGRQCVSLVSNLEEIDME